MKYIDGDYQPPSNGFPDNHCYNIWYDEHGISLDSLERGGWMAVSKGWMYGCGEFGAEGLDPEDLMNRRYPVVWKSKKRTERGLPRIYTASTQVRRHGVNIGTGLKRNLQ